jgi:hypothetical protein
MVHFASILRQIAAYLSDFCSRTKPRRPFLNASESPNEEERERERETARIAGSGRDAAP